MQVEYIPQAEVDRQLYNSCVHFATNGSVYGYDWYLNATAKEWDVLAELNKEGQYVSVMPLPYTKNWWGRHRLAQPRLLPDLAVYSVKPLSPKRIRAFWDAVPAKFRGGELTVEPASVPKQAGRFDITTAAGTALFLNRPYEEITDDFPPAYYEALARAEAADLIPASMIKPEAYADFWLEVNGKSPDNEWRYHGMQRLMYQVLHRGWGGATGVQTRDGQLMATTFNVYSHGRIFPLFPVVSEEGTYWGQGEGPLSPSSAMAYHYDMLLRSHAGKNLKIELPDWLKG